MSTDNKIKDGKEVKVVEILGNKIYGTTRIQILEFSKEIAARAELESVEKDVQKSIIENMNELSDVILSGKENKVFLDDAIEKIEKFSEVVDLNQPIYSNLLLLGTTIEKLINLHIKNA